MTPKKKKALLRIHQISSQLMLPPFAYHFITSKRNPSIGICPCLFNPLCKSRFLFGPHRSVHREKITENLSSHYLHQLHSIHKSCQTSTWSSILRPRGTLLCTKAIWLVIRLQSSAVFRGVLSMQTCWSSWPHSLYTLE